MFALIYGRFGARSLPSTLRAALLCVRRGSRALAIPALAVGLVLAPVLRAYASIEELACELFDGSPGSGGCLDCGACVELAESELIVYVDAPELTEPTVLCSMNIIIIASHSGEIVYEGEVPLERPLQLSEGLQVVAVVAVNLDGTALELVSAQAHFEKTIEACASL